MKTIGTLFYRPVATLLVVLLVVALSAPMGSTSAAAEAFISDNFNSCTVKNFWSFENPASISGATPTIVFQNTPVADSQLEMTIPSGQSITFSGSSQNAPRLMQDAADTDFEVEVKFDSPLGTPPNGSWTIQGILVRDANGGWLRFDMNAHTTSTGSTVNYYIGYISPSGSLTHIAGPEVLAGTSLSTSPLYMRVKYEKATNTWSLGTTGSGGFSWRRNFTEAVIPGGSFTVSDIGLFLGSTGSNPPGFTTRVDYFRSVTDTTFVDDPSTLTCNGEPVEQPFDFFLPIVNR